MSKIDYLIQMNYIFFNNLKENWEYNIEVKKNYLLKINKKCLLELTKKQIQELESNLKTQN